MPKIHNMHSEEIMNLNKALKYCDQLKNNLHATILHVQMLNTKYNTEQCIEPKLKYSDGNIVLRRFNAAHQTPDKLNRSLQDIKQSNNSIIVKGIKVRRNVETVVNQLKIIREIYQKDQANMFRRRMPLTLLTPIDSPAKCCHRQCFENASHSAKKKSIYSTPVNNRRNVDRKRIHLQKTC